MALSFNKAAADRVDHGNASSLNNLPSGKMSGWLWIYRTNSGNNLFVFGKESAADGAGVAGWEFVVSGALAEGDLSMAARRVTDTLYYTGAVVDLNAWNFIGFSYDDTLGAAQKIKFYKGTPSVVAASISVTVLAEGAGAYDGDESVPLIVGDVDRTGDFAFGGRIAVAAVYNRVLSLGEFISQQFQPRKLPGCVLLTHYGYNGTGTQADWSGNKNNGTVTGATVADHGPIGPPFGFDVSPIPWISPKVPLIDSVGLRYGRRLVRQQTVTRF